MQEVVKLGAFGVLVGLLTFAPACLEVDIEGQLKVVAEPGLTLQRLNHKMIPVRSGPFQLHIVYDSQGRKGEAVLKLNEGSFRFPFLNENVRRWHQRDYNLELEMTAPVPGLTDAKLNVRYDKFEVSRVERLRRRSCYNRGPRGRRGHQQIIDRHVSFEIRGEGHFSNGYGDELASFVIAPHSIHESHTEVLTPCR